MSDKATIFEQLKKALETNKIEIPKPGSWVIHPQDRHLFETGETRKTWVGIDPGIKGGDHTAVRVSQFAEPGHAYYIEHGFEPIKPPPVDFAFKNIEQRFIRAIGRAFGIPPHYFEQPEYRWQRGHFETLTDWGKRLFDRGLMDDPAIRWEYQKVVMSKPVQVIRQFIVKAKDKVYHVFDVDLNAAKSIK